MNDLGDRLTKVAIAPTGNAIAKRQKVANELKSVSNLVEEMLSITKESYNVSLTASHMGQLAFEHTVTISDLRSRIAELQTEIRSWVQRSSQDATAVMVLAEENVVLAKANGELREHMTKLNERQRKQTETLENLLANSDFGSSTTVLNEILPNGQALLDVLDLPGVYSRLIGGLRVPVPNNKGELSILAPTTLATRPDLVDSIERQLRRPLGPEVNLANAYLNVAQTRDQEVRRRGMTVYAPGRILHKRIETIFDCEPSGLRKNLPAHLKAPLPIASERSKGLLNDLQGRGSIVFCDRFFDANGNQVQDMQVAPDPFPATVLMVNAMNTNAVLSDLLRQGDIPRLLNQELKNRKPAQKNNDYRWDDLWLEQDRGKALREFTEKLLSEEFCEVDKAAVKEVIAFFMNLKKSARLFQQQVDWKNPSPRIRSVMDRFTKTGAAVVSSIQMSKGSKQQRRSSAGIGRDMSDSLSGLTVEWNTDAPSSWVWNDNQKGAALDDPKLLTRLLQKNNVLPEEDDYLAEQTKVLPVEALSSAYKKFLNADSSFVVQTFSKGGKGKGKGGKFRTHEGKSKARWLPHEPLSYDLLMLPLPGLVNSEDET